MFTNVFSPIKSCLSPTADGSVELKLQLMVTATAVEAIPLATTTKLAFPVAIVVGTSKLVETTLRIATPMLL